jgi:hypothetical protein
MIKPRRAGLLEKLDCGSRTCLDVAANFRQGAALGKNVVALSSTELAEETPRVVLAFASRSVKIRKKTNTGRCRIRINGVEGH